jgi:hypothetical protein
LMILIATDRGLFVRQDTEDQNQRADLIGKWLVLREKWPEIAKIVQRDPDKIREFETAASNNKAHSLETFLRRHEIGHLDDTKDLSRLLHLPPRFEGMSEKDLSELIFFSGTSTVRDGRFTRSVPNNGSEGDGGFLQQANAAVQSAVAPGNQHGRPRERVQRRSGQGEAGADPARSPARTAAEPVIVQRVASNNGVISVAGQKIALGRIHAREVVTVQVAADTITVDLADDDNRTVRRTTTQSVRGVKAQPNSKTANVS